MVDLINRVKKLFRKVALPIVALASMASAQDYTLHGTVRILERVSGQRLENVRVDVDSSAYVAKTDANGSYSIQVPAGIHNIRVHMPGYIGFFKQNFEIVQNTTLNVSMPDTTQESPGDSLTLKLSEFRGLNRGTNTTFPNGKIWRNVTEGNLIPVYLVNATSFDSSQFRQAIGAGTGNWQDSPVGSVENKQKRALYTLSDDTLIATPGGTRGVRVTFHAGSTNTLPGTEEGNPTYIRAAQVNLMSSAVTTITKEVFGRAFIKNDVFARTSYMNSTSAPITDLDHMLNMVFFNHWAAIARGEQDVTIYDMEEPIVCGVPDSSTVKSPTNNAVDVPLDQIIMWSNSFGTDMYQLQVAKDASFTNVVADSDLPPYDVPTLSLGFPLQALASRS